MPKPPAVPTKNPAAQALGRLGGKANTAAQLLARQQNIAKRTIKSGGRARRVCTHCGEPVTGGHVDRTLDETCGAHGWQWQTQREKKKKGD